MYRNKADLGRWLCLGLLTASLCGQITPRPEEGPAGDFRIAGVVVHGLTGQPLQQVRLSILRNFAPEILQTTTSDSEGRFSFQVKSGGKYVLVAQARGFDRQALDEHFGFFSSAVAVGEGKDSENIVFRLHPEASVSGTVTDDVNDPVRDAQVMLFHQAQEQGQNAIHLRDQTQTDDQGRYHFAHVPAGTFFVAVSAHPWYAETLPLEARAALGDAADESLDVAYPLTYYAGATDSAAATPIAVRDGDRATADVALTPAPTLKVQLTGIGSQPADAGGVFVKQAIFGVPVPAAGVQAQAERNSKGEIYITGLAAGQYVLTVSQAGEGLTLRQQPVTLSGNSEIQVKPAAAAITISGTVSLPGGGAFNGAVINLTNHAAGISQGQLLTGKGEFEFSDPAMVTGTYEVAVFNVANAALASVFATGARVVGHTLEISGTTPVQVSVVLSKGLGRVEGIALRGEKPVAGAMIVLVPQDIDHNHSLIRRDQSDTDGTFTLQRVVPGNYTVVALQNGWEMGWESAAALQPYLKGGQQVSVSPTGKYQVKVGVQ